MMYPRREMARRWVAPLPVLLLSLAVGGCSWFVMPTAAPTGDQAPVALRNLQVANVDGHRAVLLRLSRSPTLVRCTSSRRPAQITVRAWGPVGDGDLAERTLPQVDPQISQVHVSRQAGELRVVFDLAGDDPPEYSVHEMADWIMIRLQTPQS